MTDDMAERICKLVEVGNRLDTAAAACGIVRETLHKWMRAGAREPDSKEGKFAARLDEARARSEARAVANIRRAAAKDWRAEAWFLERRHASKWQARDPDHDKLEKLVADLERQVRELTTGHGTHVGSTQADRSATSNDQSDPSSEDDTSLGDGED